MRILAASHATIDLEFNRWDDAETIPKYMGAFHRGETVTLTEDCFRELGLVGRRALGIRMANELGGRYMISMRLQLLADSRSTAEKKPQGRSINIRVLDLGE